MNKNIKALLITGCIFLAILIYCALFIAFPVVMAILNLMGIFTFIFYGIFTLVRNNL